MHARELAQLAALVATHGSVLIRGAAQISDASLNQYWTASKCRLDRWTRLLKSHNALMQGAAPPQRDEHWQAVRPVLEEILTSELLTRVWTAVACAHDRRRGQNEAEPVVRSVLIGHLEARNRALQMMVFGQGIGAHQAVELNRLRRRVESWTDMLLGFVSLEDGGDDLSFDRDRVTEFADDLRYEQQTPTGRYAWPLMLASLNAAFEKGISHTCPNAELNRQIAAGVLACFGSELFDSTGQMKSLWQIRLDNTTTDAEGMLDELLSLEEPSPAKKFALSRRGVLTDRTPRF